MTAWAAVFVAQFGGRAPFHDDFFDLSLRLSRTPPTWAELWVPLNEHRLVLPRLVEWSVAQATGTGLRNQMAVNLALVSASAFAFIVAARGLRGSTAWADALFPLVLLSVGHYESLLWAVQINFYLPLLVQTLAMVGLAGAGERPSACRVGGIAVAAAALVLCGMQGVVTGLALAVWLTYVGYRELRKSGFTRAAGVAFAGAVVTFGMVAVILASYTPVTSTVPPRFGAATLRHFAHTLAIAWGPVAEDCRWAVPVRWPSPLGVATGVVVLLTVVRLLPALRDDRDRPAAVGLLGIGASLVAVAAALAYSRLGPLGGLVSNRYVTLMAPLVCWCYLTWVRFGAGRPVGELVTGGLFLTAVAVAWPNAVAGYAVARPQHLTHANIERDIYRGMPASFLAESYTWFLSPNNPPAVIPGLELLRENGVTPFQRIQPEPQITDVPSTWRTDGFPPGTNGWYETTGDVPYLFLTVRKTSPELITGVRITYSIEGTASRVSGAVSYRYRGPDGQTGNVTLPVFFDAGRGLEKRLWFGDGVDQFTILVNGPVRFSVDRVTGFEAKEAPRP
ncbi:hypothetical protein FRUB_01600 [Fimbriiglobus ruber]|uniref:Uncharacterized protein n=2 Tax=Fimbriiglobus ruber TaxID=1908690 RepID=A0A225E6Y9_9BACT|nr:hypothetical protein FRUB_01600 [Fimbriiglobus ruber]